MTLHRDSRSRDGGLQGRGARRLIADRKAIAPGIVRDFRFGSGPQVLVAVREDTSAGELSIAMAEDRNAGSASTSGGRMAQTVGRILARLGDQAIDSLYRDRVRVARTRRYALKAPRQPSSVEVLHTLLGIELKVGRRRLLCPDVATARFLAVFARLGVDEVAVPYDITQVARLADLFESAWQRMLVAIESETAGMTAQTRGRIRNLLVEGQREAISQAGPGPQMPQFDQSTSQRRRK